jgi:hypothetical protein
MRRVHLYIIFLSLTFPCCSNKYNILKSSYTFKSSDGKPDYSDLNYWAAHPWKWDPADSIPKPLQSDLRDSTVDVFFLHPTTYVSLVNHGKQNAAIDDAYINARTDYSNILYYASVFNQQCRIFAPRYRQAHMKVFLKKQGNKTDSIYEIAYDDIKAAFEYYMKQWNNGRPIIIAGHSQGAKMAERLLKEYFEDKPLQEKLVVAYLPGWSVPEKYFTSFKMCTDSLQTGCLCSWRTFRRNYIPFYLKNEKRNSNVTNPLTWTIGNEYASSELNNGSILFNFNKVYKHTTDAQISNGLVWVKKPKFPWGFLFLTRNYHPFDMRLFYMNIRDNIRQRIIMFQKQ